MKKNSKIIKLVIENGGLEYVKSNDQLSKRSFGYFIWVSKKQISRYAKTSGVCNKQKEMIPKETIDQIFESCRIEELLVLIFQI